MHWVVVDVLLVGMALVYWEASKARRELGELRRDTSSRDNWRESRTQAIAYVAHEVHDALRRPYRYRGFRLKRRGRR